MKLASTQLTASSLSALGALISPPSQSMVLEHVLSAFVSLDELHRRTRHQRFLTIWEAFVADKPNWSLERSTSRFATDLELLLHTRGRVHRLKAQT